MEMDLAHCLHNELGHQQGMVFALHTPMHKAV